MIEVRRLNLHQPGRPVTERIGAFRHSQFRHDECVADESNDDPVARGSRQAGDHLRLIRPDAGGLASTDVHSLLLARRRSLSPHTVPGAGGARHTSVSGPLMMPRVVVGGEIFGVLAVEKDRSGGLVGSCQQHRCGFQAELVATFTNQVGMRCSCPNGRDAADGGQRAARRAPARGNRLG